MNRGGSKTIRVLGSRDAGDLLVSLIESTRECWIAAAWASDQEGFRVSDALDKWRDKVSLLVVGRDFDGTDPEFLHRFLNKVRLRPSAGGTFHPKVYLFSDGRRFDAILGSSNLTPQGFGVNTEANLHLNGSVEDPLFTQIRAMLEEFARGARLLSKEALAKYEEGWRRRQKALRKGTREEEEAELPERGSAGKFGLLDLEWEDFAHTVERVGSRWGVYPEPGEPGYLGVLKEVHGTLREKRRLSRYTGADGIEDLNKLLGREPGYGYFGTTRGVIVSRVLNKDALIDRALAEIPFQGIIPPGRFSKFRTKIERVSGLGSTGGPSRLLAMKRPDWFMCVNDRNRKGLAEELGFTEGRLKGLVGYEELHEAIHSCPWYLAPRPSNGRRKALWDARVAMLDALYYKEKMKR